jgi:hypothetical protein
MAIPTPFGRIDTFYDVIKKATLGRNLLIRLLVILPAALLQFYGLMMCLWALVLVWYGYDYYMFAPVVLMGPLLSGSAFSINVATTGGTGIAAVKSLIFSSIALVCLTTGTLGGNFYIWTQLLPAWQCVTEDKTFNTIDAEICNDTGNQRLAIWILSFFAVLPVPLALIAAHLIDITWVLMSATVMYMGGRRF